MSPTNNPLPSVLVVDDTPDNLTLMSGLLYQWGGLLYALLGSAMMLIACWLITLKLPVVRRTA